jgi:hypothetical protein
MPSFTDALLREGRDRKRSTLFFKRISRAVNVLFFWMPLPPSSAHPFLTICVPNVGITRPPSLPKHHNLIIAKLCKFRAAYPPP